MARDDGGAWSWDEVVAELFAAPGDHDGGATFQLIDAGAGSWVGGVLTRTGDVLCIPYYSSAVLRVSPTNVLSFYSTGVSDGTSTWETAVLLSDGGVVALPYAARNFLVIRGGAIDKVDGGLPRAGAENEGFFEGGVVTLSSRVLLAPSAGSMPGVFDPATTNLVLLDAGNPSIASPDRRYAGAVLLADGETALMVPRGAIDLLRVTPTGASKVMFTNGFSGGLLMPDAGVLLTPSSMRQFALFNAVDESAQPSGAPTDGYFGASWSTNGFAYALRTDNPSGPPGLAIIDRQGTVAEVALPPDSGVTAASHYGLVARPDGTLVGCPYSSTAVLIVTPQCRRNVSLRTMTSPWLNKW